jgi:hypothetical protein
MIRQQQDVLIGMIQDDKHDSLTQWSASKCKLFHFNSVICIKAHTISLQLSDLHPSAYYLHFNSEIFIQVQVHTTQWLASKHTIFIQLSDLHQSAHYCRFNSVICIVQIFSILTQLSDLHQVHPISISTQWSVGLSNRQFSRTD